MAFFLRASKCDWLLNVFAWLRSVRHCPGSKPEIAGHEVSLDASLTYRLLARARRMRRAV